MRRALLQRDPPIGVRDSRYIGTPLHWCIYGAGGGMGEGPDGDYPTTIRLLVDAGETFEPSILPTGRTTWMLLRKHLCKPQMDAR